MWAMDDQDQPTRRGDLFRSDFRNRNGRAAEASSGTPPQGSPSFRSAAYCS